MPKKKSDIKDDKAPSEEPKGAPKIKDVARPGETPSPATARPLITGHGPLLRQDPMVAGKEDADNLPAEEENIAPSRSELVIKPEKAVEEPKEGARQDEPPATEEPKTEETPEETSSENEKGKAKPEKTEEEAGSDSAAIDSLASSAETKKNEAKKTEEEQKRNAKIAELSSSKKYFIPIVEGGRKASSQRIMSWILIFLLLAAVVAYLAADAGYLDVGVSLPFDLIKN